MAHENDTGALAENAAAAPAESPKSLSSETTRVGATEATMGAAANGHSEGDSAAVSVSGVDESDIPDEKGTEASHSMPAPSTVFEPTEPTDERVPGLKEQQARRPSQISLTTSELRDRELPPLPDPLPDPTPVTPKAGIPIPISTGRPQQERPERPQTPSAPMRTSSRNATTSASTARRATSMLGSSNNTQPSLSSMVFVVQALESILSTKETKRRKPLADSVQRALDAIKSAAPELPPDPAVVFEPLQVACSVQNTQITATALDCIGKLISYSYFSVSAAPLQVLPTPGTTESTEDMHAGQRAEPPPPTASIPLIERAIETICDCFQGDSTPDQVQLQIIKALLAAVLNDKVVVHGAGLLKAIRQTYNIFLLSRSSSNQMTAQGTLTQMVHTVFERVKIRIAIKEAQLAHTMGNGHGENDSSINLAAPNPVPDEGSSHAGDGDSTVESPELVANGGPPPEKITLQSFENRKSFDDERIVDNAPTTIIRPPRKGPPGPGAPATEGSVTSSEGHDDEDEAFVKDAFLVFRAMCKLSIKTLPAEQIADLKSHGMRSKLLSLHLIHTILKSHMVVLVSPLSTIRSSSSAEATGFIHAVKQYLCLALSRNAASAVTLVFEVCCEIFWLMISHVRVMLKKEIEVFLKEIYLNILDNRHSSVQQKQYLLGVLQRICGNPRALVEMYLNYDCDRSALDNMFQRIIEHLSRISATQVAMTEQQQQSFREQYKHATATSSHGFSLPPSLSTASISATPTSSVDPLFPIEYSLKRQALECLIEVLRSLFSWSQKGFVDALQESVNRESDEGRESLENPHPSPRLSTVTTPIIPTPQPELEWRTSSTDVNGMIDDPNQLEKAKQRKTALVEAIKKFNFKPKRGIKDLIDKGFIKGTSPQHIAEFILDNNNSLDKKMIGEYLGDGDPDNVATMHAFVDGMDFSRMRFVDALRRYLQTFRLPGEAQKIDRFMLKFAERYISGNPNAFANADTAYILAYSVIMLNTDLHSSKLKGRARMSPDEFVKNNRGINDNADLPEEYLLSIYEEIRTNEIVLEEERDAKLDLIGQSAGGIVEGIGRVLANAGRDLEREAYVQASEEMANKTEQLFKTLLRAQRRSGTRSGPSKFIAASSSKHVGPMFEVTWMSVLSGLSGAAQDSNETETIRLCMEGFKLAIRVACFFELETARIAFVSALAKFTHLSNLGEMKSKNVEALKVLLEIAQTEGNLLKSSWRDVLTCISQLERFQLISSGVDEGSVPDVTKGGIVRPDAGEPRAPRPSMQSARPSRQRPRTAASTHYQAEVAEESRSREVIIAVDKIFANTSKLNGEGIVHFVRALSEVSWQEIQSSGQSEHPRMFSLQKLVEISYYNMGRIRVEWSNLWNILGEHFNQVGCHSNTSVVFFALDSLRQLSMRFLEIEELPHFKFQKDFLKPFEYVMSNNQVVPVKDMVLRCLNQMLQARGNNIRSGWRTMFGTFTFAAKESYDQIVNLAFENVRKIYNNRFSVIVAQGAFADMVICLTEFAKNTRFQKISLQAIETLKGTVPRMLACPECPLSEKATGVDGPDAPNGRPKKTVRTVKDDPMVKFWFPVLFAFHDILMTGEDLEARTRALGYLFDTLVKYGGDFPPDFWDSICHELLFPIFMVLKSRSEMIQMSNQESVGMWLSTTMIQALRNLIALFTHYFDLLERMLDGFLDLLITCICQENDTIARIGSSCLQQLILQSVRKLRPEHWSKIVNSFVQLFETTTADQLFSAASQSSGRSMSGSSTMTTIPVNDLKGAVSDAVIEEEPNGENSLKINGLSSPILEDDEGENRTTSPENPRAPPNTDLEDYRPQQQQTQQPVVTAARRRFFNKIITKCVLQLLMIETVSELFSNDAVYSEIPSNELLRLMGLLKKSFTFARRFNGDKELRMRLWREGFMKQPPNLLKQESGSAATYVSILLRMYQDEQVERRESREAIEAALIPLCVDIIRGYIILDEETQQRNIVAWRPVVVDVMDGYTNFPEKDFDRQIDTFYPLAVELLGRDHGPEVRVALQTLLRRIGEVRKMGVMGRARVRDRRASEVSGRRLT